MRSTPLSLDCPSFSGLLPEVPSERKTGRREGLLSLGVEVKVTPELRRKGVCAMRKHLLFGAGVLAAGCLAWGLGPRSASSAPVPEHTLAGIRLGRTYLDVLRLYGGPNEVQTVAVPTPGAEGAPGGMPGG